MKKVILLLLLAIGTSASYAQEIKWMSFNEAMEAQKKNPKPIFMDVYTDWCGPCKMLDKNTFHDAKFVEYVSKNYYAVKFNGEGTDVIKYKGSTMTNPGHNPNSKGRNSAHQFTSYLKVQGYPSMYILDAKGEIQAPIVGYYTAEQLLPLISK